MGGIVQNWTEIRSTRPEGTIDFRLTEDQAKGSNQYNMSVFQADGTPATGTVTGTVTADFYSPGADRPEETRETVDLATGCRKFRLFVTDIDRAVFTASGLAPGNTVRVEAIRRAV